MERDNERIRRIVDGLQRFGLDAIVCILPINVLLTTGYWPVVGASVSVVDRDGQVRLLVPKDEEELARNGWPDTCATFEPATLTKLQTMGQAISPELPALLGDLASSTARIGYEAFGVSEPASYAAMYMSQQRIPDLLAASAPRAEIIPADRLLARLRLLKTPREIERIRLACELAHHGFESVRGLIRPGGRESEVAARFRAAYTEFALESKRAVRADAFAYCMSGPNAAKASAAYQITQRRAFEPADNVIVHCNSYADGFWTDITRTWPSGDASPEQTRLYGALLDARDAGIARSGPGASAREVDHAVRSVMTASGYGDAFRTATGHGVGFGAIDHSIPPQIHPKCDTELEVGMVFNIEPGAYVDGVTGARQCDMIAIVENGAQLLTPF